MLLPAQCMRLFSHFSHFSDAVSTFFPLFPLFRCSQHITHHPTRTSHAQLELSTLSSALRVFCHALAATCLRSQLRPRPTLLLPAASSRSLSKSERFNYNASIHHRWALSTKAVASHLFELPGSVIAAQNNPIHDSPETLRVSGI